MKPIVLPLILALAGCSLFGARNPIVSPNATSASTTTGSSPTTSSREDPPPPQGAAAQTTQTASSSRYLDRPELSDAQRAELAAPAESENLSVRFAANVSLALGRLYPPDEMSSGVPTALLAAFEHVYGSPGHDPRAAYQPLIDHAASFQEAWSAYETRVAEVAVTVERAGALSTNEEYDQAIAILRAEISGEHPDHRPTLMTIDAEVPALLMLGTMAKQTANAPLVFEVARSLSIRRRIENQASECLRWLVRSDLARMRRYFGGRHPNLQRAGAAVIDDYRNVQASIAYLAHGFLVSMQRDLVHRATLPNDEGIATGDWIMVEIPPGATRSGDTLQYDHTNRWNIPYDCRDTDQVTGIDPITGHFIYARRCRYRQERSRIRIRAELNDDPGSIESHRSFFLVGRAVRTARVWRLRDAFMPDLRWMASQNATRPIINTL